MLGFMLVELYWIFSMCLCAVCLPTRQPLSSTGMLTCNILQVLDRLLGYVTNVNYTAGATHM